MDTAYHTQLIFDLFSTYSSRRSFFNKPGVREASNQTCSPQPPGAGLG